MAGKVVAKATVNVDLDGKSLPRQARIQGEKAGQQAAEGYENQFAKRLGDFGKKVLPNLYDKEGGVAGRNLVDSIESAVRANASKITDSLGRALANGKGFDEYAKGFDSASDAAIDFRRRLEEVKDAGGADLATRREATASLREWVKENVSSNQALDESVKKHGSVAAAQKKVREELEQLYSEQVITKRQWQTMSSQVNRWVKSASDAEEATARLANEQGRATLSTRALNEEIEASQKLSFQKLREELYDFNVEAENTKKLQKIQDDNAKATERFRDALAGIDVELDKTGIAIQELERKSSRRAEVAIAKLREERDAYIVTRDEINRTTINLSARETERGTSAIGLLGKALAGLKPQISGVSAEFGSEGGKGLIGKFKGMSHNARQITLIVAAVAAAMTQLATLSSAAGAGLALIGSSAFAAVGGLGVAIAAIVSVTDKVKQFNESGPEGLPDYVAAIAELGPAFSEQGQIIEREFFTPMQEGLEGLPGLIDGVSPALSGLSEAMGEAVADMLEGLGSDEGIGRLSDIIDAMATQITPLMAAVSNIGSALGGFLIAAEGPTTIFLEKLERVTGTFDEWINSVEGANSVEEWLTNGMEVLDSFGVLLGSVGDLLAGLVDERSVQQTTEFLENLAAFMPALEAILGTLGELDIFGAIALALASLEPIITPIFQALEPLVEILMGNFLLAMQLLEPVLSVIGALLQPLVFLFELAGQQFEKLAVYIQPLLDSFELLGNAISDGANAIFEAILPALSDLGDELMAMLPSTEEMAAVIENEWIPAIESAVQWIIERLVPAIEEFARWMIEDGVPAIAAFVEGLIGFIGGIVGFFEGVGTAFTEFGNFLSDLFTGISDFVADVVTGIQEWWASVIAFFEPVRVAFEEFGNFISDVFTNIELAVQAVVTWFGEQWAALVAFFEPVRVAFEEFGNFIEDVFLIINFAFEMAILFIAVQWNKFMEFLEPVRLALEVFANFLGVMWEGIQDVFHNVVVWFQNKWDDFMEFLEPVRRAFEEFGNFLDDVWRNIEIFIAAAITAVRVTWDNWMAALQPVFDMFGEFGNFLSDVWRNIQDAIAFAVQWVKDKWIEWMIALQPIRNAFGEFKSFVDDVWRNIQNFIDDAVQNVKDFFDDMERGLQPLEDAIGEFGNFIDDVFGGIERAISGVASWWQTLTGNIREYNNTSVADKSPTPGSVSNGGRIPMAFGGIVSSATNALIGEAGQEAVIPLYRPIGQLDPEVQDMARMIRGMGPSAQPYTGPGAGRVLNMGPGAIVVNEAGNAQTTAGAILDRFAEQQ